MTSQPDVCIFLSRKLGLLHNLEKNVVYNVQSLFTKRVTL